MVSFAVLFDVELEELVESALLLVFEVELVVVLAVVELELVVLVEFEDNVELEFADGGIVALLVVFPVFDDIVAHTGSSYSSV